MPLPCYKTAYRARLVLERVHYNAEDDSVPHESEWEELLRYALSTPHVEVGPDGDDDQLKLYVGWLLLTAGRTLANLTTSDVYAEILS